MRDIESRQGMQKDTIFRIASQTKALVSVAVMALQEQGKLLISDDLSKYLPEFEATTVAVKQDDGGYEVKPSRRPITLRDLLTHTAGIDYGTGIAEDRWAKADIQGVVFRTPGRDRARHRLADGRAAVRGAPPASASYTATTPTSWGQ